MLLTSAQCTLNYVNEGRADELLKMIDDGIAEGVDISMDTYPYLPGSTTLASALPSWAASADDPVAVLDDPTQLAKIKHQALVTGTDGCHGCSSPQCQSHPKQRTRLRNDPNRYLTLGQD